MIERGPRLAESSDAGTVFRFVDTAGVRRKARVQDGTETRMVGRALRAAKLADCVLLVVDATRDLTDQDAMLAQRVRRAARGSFWGSSVVPGRGGAPHPRSPPGGGSAAGPRSRRGRFPP
mmetsp:Transcript_19340/g.60543  ORF Transcript_19340/g.60543 Transcript_19340/m.60543 type:complete len:120 (+) Transcript_19340:915-1274(+)